MNPFEQQPMKMQDGIVDWATLYPKPYDKRTVDPYTKIRVILMNGIEVRPLSSSTSSTACAPTTICGGDRSNSPD